MDIKKKFKLANIGFIVLTSLCMVLSIISGVVSFVEKNKDTGGYKESTEISYLINATYTEKDNISFGINFIVSEYPRPVSKLAATS